MVRRLLLWDIDGTLVRTGGIGSGAFDLALADVLGELPAGRVAMSGKTDRLIVHEHLALLGREPDPALVDAVLVRLVDRLAAEAHRIPDLGSPCPGVEQLLAVLSERADVVSGCLTGNLRPNALVKLAAFGLDRYIDLDVGAYGSDHFDRNCLLPLALERAAARFGGDFAPESTWVIGDTPLDLACARAGNARCLLVATGTYSLEELAALAPDAVLADLTDFGAVVDLLTTASEPAQP